MRPRSRLQRLVAAVLLVGTLTTGPLAAAEGLPPISHRFAQVAAEGPYPETPNFQRHVVALLGRLGCNGRSCHGSFQGRGGFRLSMFGYDFEQDHQALLGGDPPRVNRDAPGASPILLKPTDADEHEGGQRYDRAGWEYRVLRAWIAGGGRDDSQQAGQMLRLEVSPTEIVFRTPSQTAQLRVVAVWSDGTREDVTCLARFSSNDDTVADVSDDGLASAVGRGDTNLIVSYDNGVVAIPVMMPVTDRVDDRYPAVATSTRVDALIVDKLRKLGVVPSDLCSDAEFLRRVSLDISGTLPTPDQVRAFEADTAPDKRARRIDELLETPAYALWWSTKLCDFTGLNGPLYLGTTEFGPIMSEHWRSWLERKVRDNVPYDKIVAGMVVAVSRRPEQSYEDYALQMASYVVKKDPVDFTTRETMPNYWYRGNLATADDKALAFAYSFMGVRLDCAQCHKHPFDRWSQQDFKQFASIFDPIRWGVSPASQERYDQLLVELKVKEMKNASERRQSYWRWAAEGKLVPWPEVYVARDDDRASRRGADKKSRDALPTPKLLGDAEIDLAQVDDPRRPLMDWLRRADNPYFARAFVNRVWAHYFGRGIVEPADDLNLGNPPSNPELFDYLAAGFVEHGYDIKWLHREITRSDAYQRSWRANETNRGDERNFSRGRIRRLPAEVAVDAMQQATGGVKRGVDMLTNVKNRRIGAQAAAYQSRTEYALAVFGKPLRTVNCDCEREQNPSLAQAIFVRNDHDLHAMLDAADGWLKELSTDARLADPVGRAELIRLAYLRALSREPDEREMRRADEHVAAAVNPLDGMRDLLWVLLNTQEFITNH